jgi:hypothetical protein
MKGTWAMQGEVAAGTSQRGQGHKKSITLLRTICRARGVHAGKYNYSQKANT